MIQQHETNQQTRPSASPDAGVSLVNILVATDFSEISERALDHALSLARQYNSRIFLTHVIPKGLMMAPELAEASRETMRSVAREGMERLLASERFFGVPHEEI